MDDSKNSLENSRNEVASPVIKYYVTHYLKNNMDIQIPLKELREYVYRETGNDFSAGSYSGAMRDLIEENNGRIINHDRGMYMYVSNAKQYAINGVLEETISKLNSLAIDNVLLLSSQDFDTIRDIPYLSEQIEKLKYKIWFNV